MDYFDLENPLGITDQPLAASISALFAAEDDHIPALLDPAAASLILQAQFTSDLDPFLAYLAVNYLQRFLSKKQIQIEKPWIVRLVSISCLSLACKMMQSDFSLADFQEEEGFILDDRTIERMERVILGALEWRMRSITPFAFLSYFLSFFSNADLTILQALKSGAVQMIIKAQTDFKMLGFKPSVVAVAALVSAAEKFHPNQFAAFRAVVSKSEFVNIERLRECWDAMGDVAVLDGCEAAALEVMSSSATPATVLSAHHRHSSSSESDRAVGSSARPKPPTRRRLSTSAYPGPETKYKENSK